MTTVHDEDLLREYRRRGLFDNERKLLMEEFQKTDYYQRYIKDVESVVDEERRASRAEGREEALQVKNLLAVVEKKLFPKLSDFLASRDFLKSERVTSRIRKEMEETLEILERDNEQKEKDEKEAKGANGRRSNGNDRDKRAGRSSSPSKPMERKESTVSVATGKSDGHTNADDGSDMDISDDNNDGKDEGMSSSAPKQSPHTNHIAPTSFDSKIVKEERAEEETDEYVDIMEVDDKPHAGEAPQNQVPNVTHAIIAPTPEEQEAAAVLAAFEGLSRRENSVTASGSVTNGASSPIQSQQQVDARNDQQSQETNSSDNTVLSGKTSFQPSVENHETLRSDSAAVSPKKRSSEEVEDEGPPKTKPKLAKADEKIASAQLEQKPALDTESKKDSPLPSGNEKDSEDRIAAVKVEDRSVSESPLKTRKRQFSVGDIVAAFTPYKTTMLKCYQVKVKAVVNEDPKKYVVEDLAPDEDAEETEHTTWELEEKMIFDFKGEKKLRKNMRCFALFRNQENNDASTEFYFAHITAVHKTGVFDVEYFDRELGFGLHPDDILVVDSGRKDLFRGVEAACRDAEEELMQMANIEEEEVPRASRRPERRATSKLRDDSQTSSNPLKPAKTNRPSKEPQKAASTPTPPPPPKISRAERLNRRKTMNDIEPDLSIFESDEKLESSRESSTARNSKSRRATVTPEINTRKPAKEKAAGATVLAEESSRESPLENIKPEDRSFWQRF
ncbi:hypothetical protein HDU96_003209 [Phlyctochytrium bullatum]|nr:hypothetical protein HDU96_003209 [Phlyctochytrium bullatum]